MQKYIKIIIISSITLTVTTLNNQFHWDIKFTDKDGFGLF